MQHPGRCYRPGRAVTFHRRHQSQTICQCYRLSAYHPFQIGIGTYSIFEIIPYDISCGFRLPAVVTVPPQHGHQPSDDRLCGIPVRQFSIIAYIPEKSAEFCRIFQKTPVYRLQPTVKSGERSCLIIEKIPRLNGIVLRIVQFIHLQFVILQELVVGFLREQQR